MIQPQTVFPIRQIGTRFGENEPAEMFPALRTQANCRSAKRLGVKKGEEKASCLSARRQRLRTARNLTRAFGRTAQYD